MYLHVYTRVLPGTHVLAVHVYVFNTYTRVPVLSRYQYTAHFSLLYLRRRRCLVLWRSCLARCCATRCFLRTCFFAAFALHFAEIVPTLSLVEPTADHHPHFWGAGGCASSTLLWTCSVGLRSSCVGRHGAAVGVCLATFCHSEIRSGEYILPGVPHMGFPPVHHPAAAHPPAPPSGQHPGGDVEPLAPPGPARWY